MSRVLLAKITADLGSTGTVAATSGVLAARLQATTIGGIAAVLGGTAVAAAPFAGLLVAGSVLE
jgi:hypothetical protein